MYLVFAFLSISKAFILNNRKIRQTRIFNYNLDGDLSGSYKLSGVWKLYREPTPKIENPVIEF